MHILKSLALASVSLLPITAVAFSADAIKPEPFTQPMPVVSQAPQNIWEGGYTGLYLGYGLNKSKTNAAEIGTQKYNAPQFGAYAGWNIQNGQLVYGVEGDAGLNWAKKSKNDVQTKLGFDGSVRGRVGLALGPIMPYITAGVAGTQASLKKGDYSQKKFRAGWTAGAGAEAFITENVVARAEYRYTDFGKKAYDLGGENVRSGLKSHSVRLGLAYKF